ncbi:hypothetical protein TRVL_05622 [Trypanosoma vivax]|nr:hypothetical protein TRVL_05622 [Trypanosoma vivax]
MTALPYQRAHISSSVTAMRQPGGISFCFFLSFSFGECFVRRGTGVDAICVEIVRTSTRLWKGPLLVFQSQSIALLLITHLSRNSRYPSCLPRLNKQGSKTVQLWVCCLVVLNGFSCVWTPLIVTREHETTPPTKSEWVRESV